MKFTLVGLPDNAVRESYDRIHAAFNNTGFRMPVCKTVINMAPANIRKEGSGYDLPMAIGIMACNNVVAQDKLKNLILLGELGLDGSLHPIRGALPMAIKARDEHFEGIILPADNAREAAVVNQLKVFGAHNLCEVVDFLNGKPALEQTIVDTRREFHEQQNMAAPDFIDVKGQESV